MSQPLVSVVVASLNGRGYLDRCLRSLADQTYAGSVEIIVADAVGEAIRSLIAEQYPQVTLISMDAPQTIGALRFAAMQAAGGEIIALTEDHCILPPEWIAALVTAHQQHPAPAIGGSLENGAAETAADRIAFWCEYAAFSADQPAGSVRFLAGANVSYKRAALAWIGKAGEFWEGQFHAAIASHGGDLRFEPGLRVVHRKHFTLIEYWRERFALGRWFASARRDSMPSIRWLAMLIAMPLIGALIAVRMVRSTTGSGIGPGALITHLPLIVASAGVGWLGEVVGHLAGAGRSAYLLR